MKGILFKDWKIRFIAEHPDMEIQTRRVIKNQPHYDYEIITGYYNPVKVDKNGDQYPGEKIFGAYSDDGEWGVRARYQPGETVYIKEPHYRFGCWKMESQEYTMSPEYKTKTRWSFIPHDIYGIYFNDNIPGDFLPRTRPSGRYDWYVRSPLFLPEKFARYFVNIKSVEAQRLHDITEDDALAEGVGYGFTMNAGFPDYQHINNGVCELTQDTATASYASLWDSINKDYPYESNILVFKIVLTYLT